MHENIKTSEIMFVRAEEEQIEEQESKQIEDITSLSIQCRLATHDEPERTEKYYSFRSLHMWLTCISKLK